jgi:hypothetical protein
LAALGVVGAVVLNMEDLVSPTIGLPVLMAAVLLAWRFTEGFWKTVAFGLVGGVVAGALIMGPGFRLSMRVVAIMEPIRTPEFSIEGTLFIIIGIGGIFGGIFALVGNLIRRVFSIKSAIASGVVLAALVMTTFLSETDLRAEFTDLGGGPWVNIPMFAIFVLGYGIAAMAIAEYMERQAAGRDTSVVEPEKVPA